jgi:hypothetical protein
MRLQAGRRMARIAAVGLLSMGLLAGCGESVTITVPTFPSVEEAIKDIGQSAADGITNELRKVIDTTLPINQQVEQLQAKSKELYCGADNSALADAIKGLAQAVWTDITRNSPDAPKLDLTKDDCAK